MLAQLELKDIKLHPDRTYRGSIPKISQLAKSLAKANGLLQPIGVDKDNFLIFGLRRL